jgi:UDP-N-acetylmuramoyl-tripeptide--D-alanyl-D-alanine ligase
VKPRRLSEIARAVRGSLEGDDVRVGSVSTDSRSVSPGGVFVAIRGERLDGETFIEAAARAGASAAIVGPDAAPASIPLVRVDDPGTALLELASVVRDELGCGVVGITGANGKTSTKDLTAAVLGTRMRTFASPRSFNTEVGVPMTVLAAPNDTEVLVLELGARHVGDVRLLCARTRPNVVVVTNVGLAHLEVFGSWEAIVEASAEPVEALDPHGTAVLAADDRVVRSFADRTTASVVTFGLADDASVRAVDVELDRLGRASFTAVAGPDRARVVSPIPGEHMVQNVLASIAVGSLFGVGLAEAADALADARIAAWRMETFELDAGVVLVNDAYNANPESMAAGLKTARWIARDGRLVAVLGHMAELGSISLTEHERLGDLVTRLGVDVLVTVGDRAAPIARGAVREGLEPDAVHPVASPDAAAALLRSLLRPGDVVFLKGSRVAGLERVAAALRGTEVPA